VASSKPPRFTGKSHFFLIVAPNTAPVAANDYHEAIKGVTVRSGTLSLNWHLTTDYWQLLKEETHVPANFGDFRQPYKK
jgi:hypothetical protein